MMAIYKLTQSWTRGTSRGLQTYLPIAVAVDDRHKESLQNKKNVNLLTAHDDHSTEVFCITIHTLKNWVVLCFLQETI